MPFYKTFFPGSGADYHYFGSVPFQKRGKLAVNNKCQLQSYNNIFVVDGSVLSYLPAKSHTFTIMANSERISKSPDCISSRHLVNSGLESKSDVPVILSPNMT